MTKTIKSTPRNRARLIPAEEVFAKARQQEGYQEAYDALEEEFALVAALIKARMEAGLTQQQVADRMHTTQGNVARIEGGRILPSTRTLRRYAEATGHRLKITFEPISRKIAR